MTRPTVLLVSPPVLHAQSWWANRIANKPHLASLAGSVRDLAEVDLLELDIEAGDEGAGKLTLLDDHLSSDVALVGISCWTSLHYLGALEVARRVRRWSPDLPIVVGGHHPTAAPGDFDHDHCDYLVIGDGEHPLRRLCEEWPGRPDRIQTLPGRPFSQSDPDHIDWAHYGRPDDRAFALWVGLSRGCGFKCRFCVEPQRGTALSGYAVPDALAIVEGLLRSHEPRVIAFSDPLFGTNRRWTEAFLDGLEARDLPLRFWAQTRADLMTPALLERFKRCGFMLDFGLDTASATMVERMEKSANPERYLARAREIFEHADAIGLHHGIYIVFNFPGETPETVEQTQAFLDAIGDSGGPLSGWLSCQTFFILPGTHAHLRMAHNADAYGTEIRNPAWWKASGDHYRLATDVLPSSAWKGREDELSAFQLWNQQVNARWSARYTPEVQAFRRSIYFG